MATYKEVQEYVRSKHGFVPKTCWIAHVLADDEKTTRAAGNRISPDARMHPCPEKRRPQVESALSHFGMIELQSK